MSRTSVQIKTLSKPEIMFADDIDSSMFSADMLRFVNTSPFQDSALALGAGGVRWPGEILVDPTYGNATDAQSERWINSFNPDGSVKEYVYDLKHDNIVDTVGYPREGLREALAFAAQNDLAFTMLIPEDRYINIDVDASPGKVFSSNLDQAFTDIDVFLTRLLSGYYGDVPKEMTLQIGQEYYTGQVQFTVQKYNLDHEERIVAIGQLYNDIATHIAEKTAELTQQGRNSEQVDPKVMVHMGRLFGDYGFGDSTPSSGSVDDAYTLSAQFDADGFDALDALLFQRYVPKWEGIADGFSDPIRDHTISDVERIWEIAADSVGLPDKQFEIEAGWAMSSTIRNEIRAEYQRKISDRAFQDRTDMDFERFVQNFWENKEIYGDKHASSVLQLFTELVAAGVDAATYYGVDLGGPGQLSAKAIDGEIVTFTAGTLFKRLAENVTGTIVNRSYLDNSRINYAANNDPQVNLNVFESDTKIVAYVWVNDIGHEGLTVDLQVGDAAPLNGQFSSITSTSVRSIRLESWREKFDVVNLDQLWGAGFQDPEAATFEVAYTNSAGELPSVSHAVAGTTISLDFIQDYEIIEVIYERDLSSFVFEETTPAGSVSLEGKSGDDVIRGSEDDDFIRGREGDDRLVGGGGSDTLYGDTGSDVIFGGTLSSYLYGGYGDDSIFGSIGDDYISGGVGQDKVEGGRGDDIIFGNNGRDDLIGGDGADAINGGGGDDLMRGQNGHDVLNGGRGNDVIYGGAGADLIFGGEGDDTLHGGSGADIFFLLRDFGHDKIQDFSSKALDSIDISAYEILENINSFLLEYAEQRGDDVHIRLDNENSILISNFDLDQLSQDDLIF